jgi:hypothetical protein
MEFLAIFIIIIGLNAFAAFARRKKKPPNKKTPPPSRRGKKLPEHDEFGLSLDPKISPEEQRERSLEAVRRREEAKEKAWNAETERKKRLILKEREGAAERQKEEEKPYDRDSSSVKNPQEAKNQFHDFSRRERDNSREGYGAASPRRQGKVREKRGEYQNGNTAENSGHIFLGERNIINGLIFSELLQPPKALRSSRKPRPPGCGV